MNTIQFLQLGGAMAIPLSMTGSLGSTAVAIPGAAAFGLSLAPAAAAAGLVRAFYPNKNSTSSIYENTNSIDSTYEYPSTTTVGYSTIPKTGNIYDGTLTPKYQALDENSEIGDDSNPGDSLTQEDYNSAASTSDSSSDLQQKKPQRKKRTPKDKRKLTRFLWETAKNSNNPERIRNIHNILRTIGYTTAVTGTTAALLNDDDSGAMQNNYDESNDNTAFVFDWNRP